MRNIERMDCSAISYEEGCDDGYEAALKKASEILIKRSRKAYQIYKNPPNWGIIYLTPSLLFAKLGL